MGLDDNYWNLNDLERKVYSKIEFSQTINCCASLFGTHGLKEWIDMIRESDQPVDGLYSVYILFENIGYFCPKHMKEQFIEKQLGFEYLSYKERKIIKSVSEKVSLFFPGPIACSLGFSLGPIGVLFGSGIEYLMSKGSKDFDEDNLEKKIDKVLEEAYDTVERWKSNNDAKRIHVEEAYNALRNDGVI